MSIAKRTKPTNYERFDAWQTGGEVHPFTCSGGGGTCTKESKLEMVGESEKHITLRCPVCQWEQCVVKGSALGELIERHPVKGLKHLHKG